MIASTRRRVVILLGVIAVHAALVAALLSVQRRGERPGSPDLPVEVRLLPPARIPRVRAEIPGLRRIHNALNVEDMPLLPALAAPMAAATPDTSSVGRGSGVDWSAEARRSLQAFEIRHHQSTGPRSISSDPIENGVVHRPGDHSRTAAGDWVVWIDADCYQVATSSVTGYAVDAVPHVDLS